MATSTTRKSTAAKPAAAKSSPAKSKPAAAPAKPVVKKDRPSKAAAVNPAKGALEVKVGRKHTHVLDSAGAKVAWIPTGMDVSKAKGTPGRVRVNFDGGAWVANGQVEAVAHAVRKATASA